MIKLPKGVDVENLIKTIRKLSWDSSNLLRSYSQIKESKLDIKNLKSGPVTSADINVNNIIIGGIKKAYPNQTWFFLSEESYKEDNLSQLIPNDWVWIIDPLDGTKDFINKTGEYATHIALTFKKKIILGVVIVPIKEEVWFFIEGRGTWCENKNLSKKDFINTNNKNLKEITIVTSRSHRYPELDILINELNPANVIEMGSIGYKITSIIRNEADLYISYSEENKSSPKDWDMAAPEAILRGCGGSFTKISGENLKFLENKKFNQSGILVASMTTNHINICKKINEILI